MSVCVQSGTLGPWDFYATLQSISSLGRILPITPVNYPREIVEQTMVDPLTGALKVKGES